MSEQPYFSIGVTTFNRRELLIETLSSILAQSFADFEVIVGNDNTGQLLTREMLGIDDPRVRILNHAVNLGEIGNMNELLAQSRGRYFSWLADDDLYTPDFLQAVRDAHQRFGAVPCIFTGYAMGATSTLERTAYDQRMEQMPGREFLRKYLDREIQALGCYGVFETRCLRDLGGMERLGLGFSPYSDNLLAIKAGALAHVCYIDAPLIFFRTHSESISYSSPDVTAYFTAQEDLCERALKVFRLPQLRDDLQHCLYQLLSHWCMTFMFHVIRRPQDAPPGRTLGAYMKFLLRTSRELDLRPRARLTFMALEFLLRHWLFVLRRRYR